MISHPSLVFDYVLSMAHSNGWYIVPPSAIFLAIATIAVILRFTSRHKQKQKIGADDVLIVIALILSYAFTILTIFCKYYSTQKIHLIRKANNNLSF